MAVRSHSLLLRYPQADNRGGLLGLTVSDGLLLLSSALSPPLLSIPPTPHHWDQMKPTPCTKSPRGATHPPHSGKSHVIASTRMTSSPE